MFHENELSRQFPEVSENYWFLRLTPFSFLKWKLRFYNVLPYLKKNGWVLDIGCGDAFFGLLIAKHGFRLVNSEISKDRLVKAISGSSINLKHACDGMNC